MLNFFSYASGWFFREHQKNSQPFVFFLMRLVLIQSEIDRILKIAREDPTVERIFLFGSATRPETIHEESDIDLCIVQRTNRRFLDRLADWMDRLEPKAGLDLVVYTPEEFNSLRVSSEFVKKQIELNGKEIYAA